MTEKRKRNKNKTPKQKGGFIREIRKNAFLYGMTVPGILYVALFFYVPMCGLVMAFQNVNMAKGVFGSEFIGLSNFKFIFSESIFPQIIRAVGNTLWLNILFMITGTVFAVFISIVFSEIRQKHYKKITQSISILPYFISWAVISLFLNAFISQGNGIFTQMLAEHGINIAFYDTPGVWPPLLVILKIWQGGGYSAIVYLATIAGIDPGIYEAAEIDGATRLQRILHITIPVIRPTIILLTIFNIGRIFYGDFGMLYALVGDNAVLYPTTDVVDTFVYRMMRQLQEYGLSTAVGMVQSIAGCIIVVGANALARKFEPDSAIF